MSFLDVVIVVLSLAYVLLLSREIIWAWPAGILSSAILIWVAWDQNLYSDMGLYAYYVAMGIWGWHLWSSNSSKGGLLVQRLQVKESLLLLGLGLVGMVGLRYTLGNLPNASLPWLDAFTTSFSLVGTYLQAKKYLENWLLWLVVNAFYIGIYAYKGVNSVAFLSIVYLFMSAYGFIHWRRLMAERHTASA